MGFQQRTVSRINSSVVSLYHLRLFGVPPSKPNGFSAWNLYFHLNNFYQVSRFQSVYFLKAPSHLLSKCLPLGCNAAILVIRTQFSGLFINSVLDDTYSHVIGVKDCHRPLTNYEMVTFLVIKWEKYYRKLHKIFIDNQ